MTITKAELQERYDDLAREVEALKRADREFRERIVTVAAKAAYDHDLCEVLDDTLSEIGLDVPDVEIVVETTTLYKMNLIEAHRLGFLDSDNDLKDAVNNWICWDAPDASEQTVANVTIKQPV